ncbi:IS30 family transposase [Enterococcus faecalis]|uniref:IS30 family transposase n=5 Tax=Enterococcus TaxID=1350 RepID=UPI00255A8AA9|nr:IS30 family transposase [Enterococcus faecalis]MDL4925255.1 IS30 family transposase [Enterococcus faecalis]
MSYNHLSAEERGQIEAYLKEGVSQAEIARRLDRHRSTISREIKRGSEQRKKKSLASLPYQATSAGNLASIRKKNCGTTTKATVHNTKTIMKYLDMKYSPEQIANAVRSVKVCTSTIYNWIYKKIVPFDIKKLRGRGKRYKIKNTGKRLKRPDRAFFERRTLENRPEEVQLRTEFGHWEADTVVSKQGVAACLATFIERKTRHYVAIKIPNKTGRSMMTAIKRLVEMYPHGVKSITCDRGSEFVNQFEIGLIEDTFDCKIYYANPCAPHERGSNENHNGLLREYFPKPSNFKNISQNKINQAVQSMNLRPRKIFKWKSPQHKFNLEYSKAFYHQQIVFTLL